MTDEISIKEPMRLTHQNVEDVFKDCLARTTEYTLKGVCIEVAFNREKIAEHEQDIMQMLMQLPKEFHRPGGCGWSFLNMCIDKNGNQWTDYHRTQDKLVCLGRAIGAVEFVMQRDLWKVFPGGMPYIVINDNYNIAAK